MLQNSSAREMAMSWSTDAGQVTLTFPSNLSSQDANDVQDLLTLTLVGIRRRAQAIEAAEADETRSGSAVGESAVSGGNAPDTAHPGDHHEG